MCAFVRCGIAFSGRELWSLAHAASMRSIHAYPSLVVKPGLTKLLRICFTKCGKSEQKCSSLEESTGCATLHVMSLGCAENEKNVDG